jgi:hypothetical protein
MTGPLRSKGLPECAFSSHVSCLVYLVTEQDAVLKTQDRQKSPTLSFLRVGRAWLPSAFLAPLVRFGYDFPDKRVFAIRITESIFSELFRQTILQLSIASRIFLVNAHIIPKQESALLGPTTCASHMDMGSALPRPFTKVPFGQIWVVCPKNKPQALDRGTIRIQGLKGRDRDLNVNDRLCV